MKIIGLILIAFGLVDFIGSYADFDLWGEFLHVRLPDVLWKYSAMIEMGVGYLLMTIGSRSSQSEAQA